MVRKSWYWIVALITIWACDADDVSNTIIVTSPIEVGFTTVFATATEGSVTEYTIDFSKEATEAGVIEISLDLSQAEIDQDFTIVPAPAEETLKLPFSAGSTSVTFTIEALTDADDDVEVLHMTISSIPGFMELSDGSNVFELRLRDNTTSTEVLTVITWNIENYPKQGNTTIQKVAEIISAMDADVIAFQEMDDPSAFTQLDNLLTDWEGALYDVRGGIELAYLYKPEEITAFSALSTIYNDDNSAFPRQPVVVTATHISGEEVILVNIHLKCCSEGENRRADASAKLKNYIDSNWPDENVVVLGDFNDDILSGSPFSNFINDSENYEFADMPIAIGSSANWSYPGWPSHIDHILITNELADNLTGSEVLRLDETVSSYDAHVSDHRPVTATFSF